MCCASTKEPLVREESCTSIRRRRRSPSASIPSCLSPSPLRHLSHVSLHPSLLTPSPLSSFSFPSLSTPCTPIHCPPSLIPISSIPHCFSLPSLSFFPYPLSHPSSPSLFLLPSFAPRPSVLVHFRSIDDNKKMTAEPDRLDPTFAMNPSTAWPKRMISVCPGLS